jgi:hypothetical protein
MFGPMPRARTPKRDFTIPDDELRLIREIQSRCRKLDLTVNDSEVVRLGIAALVHLNDKQLLQRVKALARLRRGPRSRT